MKEKIRVMIVEDSEITAKNLSIYLNQFEDMEVICVEHTKEKAIEKAIQLKPDILLLDIKLTDKDDQYGTDISIELSIKAPEIKIIMLSAILNEDTVRSTMGLDVAFNYILKSRFEEIPSVIRDAYKGIRKIEGTIVELILRDYQNSLKLTMSGLTKQQIKILELFYRGYTVEQVADIMKLEVQSVRNYQQKIAKRCVGWKWRFKKLSTVELAKRAKVMGLF